MIIVPCSPDVELWGPHLSRDLSHSSGVLHGGDLMMVFQVIPGALLITCPCAAFNRVPNPYRVDGNPAELCLSLV